MMTEATHNTDYYHDQPQSLIARISKVAMRLLRMKRLIERDMQSGQIKQNTVAVPAALTTSYQMTVSELDGRKIWTFKPQQPASERVVLFLHGGAYIYNIQTIHWQFVQALLDKTGATVVVPDYPLAPQQTCLTTLDFVARLYDQLRATTAADDLILMGDSAGAGLALGFAHHLRDHGQALPRHLILLAPWLDITMSNPDIAAVDGDDPILSIHGLQMAGAAYAGDLDPHDPRVSPLHGDFHGLPPMSLFIGTHDLFIADSRKLRDKLRAANLPLNYYEYPRMIHDWVVIANLKEAQHAITQIAHIVNN